MPEKRNPLTGASMAKEALTIGLVSRVMPDEELIGTGVDLAGRIGENPARATRITRRFLKRWRGAALDDVLWSKRPLPRR